MLNPQTGFLFLIVKVGAGRGDSKAEHGECKGIGDQQRRAENVIWKKNTKTPKNTPEKQKTQPYNSTSQSLSYLVFFFFKVGCYLYNGDGDVPAGAAGSCVMTVSRMSPGR